MAITEKSKLEESGISDEMPVRGDKESDTYWNIRVLSHSILGQQYKTPQFNMDYLLIEFLNSKLPPSNKIDKEKSKFVAQGDKNLNFSINKRIISFNANLPIDKKELLRVFGLKDA